MPPLRYREYDPHPALARYVLCYWEFWVSEEQAPFTHHVLPDGCVVMAYGRRGEAAWMSLIGPSLDGLQVPMHPGDVVWGVRFWPGAAGALLPLEPLRLRGEHGLLADVLPDLTGELEERLSASRSALEAAATFDHVLRGRLPQARSLDAVVRTGVEAVVATQGRLAICELAQHLGLSERQLQRRFRRAVGLTPKQFARIRRLRSSVANAMGDEPKGWGRVAAEQGYADQAHLAREFSELVGQPPTTFLERTRAIEHVDVTP